MPRYPQAILISCEIPWDQKEQLLESTFREEIRFVRRAGFDHVYVFGTAGEGYAVDVGRFKRIAEIFREETQDPAARPMVGAIGLSSALVIERVAIAYQLGFRTFQIAMPCWGALRDAEVLTFFRDVCGSFPDAAFLHYNLPRAKRVLNGADYRRIIDVVPNLVATKNTGGGSMRAEDLMTHAPELQHFFGEHNFLQGALHGECSLLSSFGGIAPRATKEFFQAGRERQLERLFQLQGFFTKLVNGVFRELLAEDRIDGAYDKILVRLSGFDAMPLRLLSPYQCFTEAQYLECKRRYVEDFNRGRFEG